VICAVNTFIELPAVQNKIPAKTRNKPTHTANQSSLRTSSSHPLFLTVFGLFSDVKSIDIHLSISCPLDWHQVKPGTEKTFVQTTTGRVFRTEKMELDQHLWSKNYFYAMVA
jgi:hypothetical protein